jgi:hypothetical protein
MRAQHKRELSVMDKRDGVTRREFVKASALLGAGVFIAGVEGTEAQQEAGPDAASVNDKDKYRIIENEIIRLTVSAVDGAITGLFNKKSGKEYIAEPQQARAFRLNVPDPERVTGYNADWSANSLDSWQQKKCTISTQSRPQGQVMTVEYKSLQSEAGLFSIEVRYSIRLPDNSEDAFLKLEVVNHSHYHVNEVFFPWVSGIGSIDGMKSDTFVAPNVIQSVPELRRSYDGGSNWEEYPYLLGVPHWPNGYGLSMPWMNYGGKTEGLYLASLCRDGIRHMLVIQDFGAPKDPVLAFAWAFAPFIEPGHSWETPEIQLSLHPGDWHVAADKYRKSLEGWYQKPDLTPASKASFASFNGFFTTRDFMKIADLAKDIKQYGLSELVMWNFGDYYPRVLDKDDLSVDPPRLGQFTDQWGGLEKLRKANHLAELQGVRTGIIFSQRLWNTHTLTPEMQKLAEKWVVRTMAGTPVTESWVHQHLGASDWSSRDPYFGYSEYVICDVVKEYQEFATSNIMGVLGEGGYSCMFFDQAVESQLCFNPEHNHKTPSEPSMNSHFFLESLSKSMRGKNADWRLVGEGWELLASQSMDMGWVWTGQNNAEVFRYTLPWAKVARAVHIDENDANRQFILGIHLAIIPKGVESGKNLSDFPGFAQHISGLASLHEGTERFWTDGVFKDDIGLTVVGAFGKIYQTQNEIAVMIANLSGQPSSASFELDAVLHHIEESSFSVASSTTQKRNETAQRMNGILKGDIALRSYEVIAAIFERNHKDIS